MTAISPVLRAQVAEAECDRLRALVAKLEVRLAAVAGRDGVDLDAIQQALQRQAQQLADAIVTIQGLRLELTQAKEIARSHADQLTLYRDLFARIQNLAAAGVGAETVLSLPELPVAAFPAPGATKGRRPANRRPARKRRGP